MLKKLETRLEANRLLAPLLIAVCVFAVYVCSIPNNFVLDDPSQVLNVQVAGFDIPRIFGGSSFGVQGTSTPAGQYYKPLMTTTYALIYKVFGANPAPFHLFQILLAMANAILVFYLLKKFLHPTLALLLALLFGVHPFNSEAVLYVSDLQDMLFFFFGMLGLLFATKHVLSKKDIALSVFFMLLSLLSKETGLLFILMAVAYRLIFFRTKGNSNTLFVALGVLLAFFIPLRFGAVGLPTTVDKPYPIMRLDLLGRLFNVPAEMFYYIRNFFFPYDFAIAQHWVIKGVTLTTFYLPLTIDVLVILILSLFALFLHRIKSTLLPIYIFFLLWFLLGMAAHLNIYPLDVTVADRWFYMPGVGLIAMLGIMAATYKLDRKQGFFLLFCIILFILGVRTLVRTFDWRTGLTLATRDVQFANQSFPLENNLAFELINVGRYDEALVHAQKSVEEGPWWWLNWNNLGVIYRHKGFTQDPKYYKNAEDAFRKAVANGGTFYLPYENLAELLTNYDTPQNAQAFIVASSQKITLSGRMFFDLAIVQLELKDTKGALQAANQARLMLPNDPQVQALYQAIKAGKTITIRKPAY
ncbi:MAG: glycosyltransferase family 39 protein [Candidatus Levyibacteriota bacterium]